MVAEIYGKFHFGPLNLEGMDFPSKFEVSSILFH